MLKYLFSLAFIATIFLTSAQDISYTVSMERPQNHYFQVEMNLEGFKQKEVNVKMPIWAPGSYLAREFAKNVNLVKAFDEKGNPLLVKKTDKNTWNVKKGKTKSVKIKYEVYAFELTVRTSFLDMTHGFISGSGVFMYVQGHKDKSGEVNVVPHSSFQRVTTALKQAGDGVTGDGKRTYTFEDYDQLVDCPIEVGNQLEFDFDAAGVKHHVAIYGTGNHNPAALKEDMANMVEAATRVFGQNPNKEYTFIIHNVVDGQGGLEHKNSTVLSVNRWTYSGEDYVDFLDLVAHEYFHLWNVKRIRPVELGPFNYDSENYTSLLWVMEGFTSYYEKMILLRAGYYSQKQFLSKMFSSLNYVEGSTGARVQPVAHASFDAWIKAYRPNENSRNTTASYYSRGSVVAMMIDAMIIKSSDGTKCLDNFMQHIYKVYYEGKDRGFTEAEFKAELEAFIGKDLTEFYEKYIDGTVIPDYNSFLEPLGVAVTYKGESKPSSGLTTRGGENVYVRAIRSGSAAEDAGLSVNDEIIAVNNYRVNKPMLDAFLKSLDLGDQAEILFSREEELHTTTFTMTAYEKPRFEWKKAVEDPDAKRLYDFWLGKK
ncbi:MAG: peptidase M61 [Fluviicola sp. XM-24bin1]|nr:MAG: peptidase M61 [Fluviicola sp. XM-24bin1]